MEKTLDDKKYSFFWGGFFSNWYPSTFNINGITYNCGEQYMMAQKAKIFGDIESEKLIMITQNPKEQQAIGRRIKNFDSKKWDEVKYELVKKGLREKYNQNIVLKNYLLERKDCLIVEASPYDKIWGIGFDDHDALDNIDNWGENLLGKILTELANE